jgi:hypothetical protein
MSGQLQLTSLSPEINIFAKSLPRQRMGMRLDANSVCLLFFRSVYIASSPLSHCATNVMSIDV